MKRLLLDLGVVVVFMAEYFCEQALPEAGPSSIMFIIFNPVLMFVGIASLAAFVRGVVELRVFVSPTILRAGIVEWICLVIISYVLACLLDVIRHPPENFITVFGFNLFILLMPALVVSTIAYVVGRVGFNRFRNKT